MYKSSLERVQLIFHNRVFKLAMCSLIAITLSEYFNLLFPYSAGVIAILSLQKSKKAFFRSSFERGVSTLFGLGISALIFYYLGATNLMLSLFILIFLPICIKLNVQQGFVANVVLATHLLNIKVITWDLLLNEILLVVIGIGVAGIFNSYSTSSLGEIDNLSSEIDLYFRKILKNMSESLESTAVSIEEEKLFTELKAIGQKARTLAELELENTLLNRDTRVIDELNMKYTQYKLLKKIRNHFFRLNRVTIQGNLISKLFSEVSLYSFSKATIHKASEKIEEMKKLFKEGALPTTREEFENRAILYQILNDIEDFVNIRIDFYKVS